MIPTLITTRVATLVATGITALISTRIVRTLVSIVTKSSKIDRMTLEHVTNPCSKSHERVSSDMNIGSRSGIGIRSRSGIGIRSVSCRGASIRLVGSTWL